MKKQKKLEYLKTYFKIGMQSLDSLRIFSTAKREGALLALTFIVSACGVKGDPKPPLTPAEIGHGQPSFKRGPRNPAPVSAQELDSETTTTTTPPLKSQTHPSEQE